MFKVNDLDFEQNLGGRMLLMTTPYLPEELVPSGIAKFAEQFRCFVPGLVLLKYGAGVAGLGQFIIFKQIFKVLNILRVSNSPILHVNTAAERKAIVRDLLMVMIVKVLIRRASIIIHVHGGAYTTRKPTAASKFFFLSMFKLCDHCIILQKGALDLIFNENGNKYLDSKITVIGNFTTVFKSRELSEFVGIDSLVYMGRLSPEKRVSELVAAFFDLISLGFAGNFYIVGNGILRSEIEDQIDLLGVRDRVILCGALFGDEKQKILSQCRYLVLNSVYEGMPMVVLEAMSCSLIPIVTPVGALPDVIGCENGNIGRRGFFLPRDALSASDLNAILHIDDAVLYDVSLRAHEYALQKYSPGKVIPIFMECYSKL